MPEREAMTMDARRKCSQRMQASYLAADRTERGRRLDTRGALTDLDRVCAERLPPAQRATLEALRAATNPRALRRAIHTGPDALLRPRPVRPLATPRATAVAASGGGLARLDQHRGPDDHAEPSSKARRPGHIFMCGNRPAHAQPGDIFMCLTTRLGTAPHDLGAG